MGTPGLGVQGTGYPAAGEWGFSLGWRPEFPWERLTAWEHRTPGIHFIERRPMPPLGHFSLIRYGKDAALSAAA